MDNRSLIDLGYIRKSCVFLEREESLLKYMEDGVRGLNRNIKIIDKREGGEGYSLGIYMVLEGNDDVIKVYRVSLPKEEMEGCVIYNLSSSEVKIHVDIKINNMFRKIFKNYIRKSYDSKGNYKKENVCTYDNLVHMCMMVKNAGDNFRKYLETNLQYIDRWTILDTGSTDSTVEVIKEVMKGKEGDLYEEPFINFRDSRNRCLDLAYGDGEKYGGNQCVYTIMLDDTYTLGGSVRGYLSSHRTEKEIDSFHIYIKCSEGEYASNRICRTEKKLRYIFKIHEVIQPKNNNLKDIPSNMVWIDDENDEYMKTRTKDRKIDDIVLLLEEIEENPEEPRNYFYMAQTYLSLEDYEKVKEYYLKRIELLDKGNREEVIESYYNLALIGDQFLGWTWPMVEYYLNKCHLFDPRKPDALYYIGYHYVHIGEEEKGYNYLKKAFELGSPSKYFNSFLRDKEIYNGKLAYHLTPLCYKYEDYNLGFRAASRFLENNKDDNIEYNYNNMVSWLSIYKLLCHDAAYATMGEKYISAKNIICFVADGGFKSWNGQTINEEGVGGSETYIIELARNIANLNNIYEVHVFCKCNKGGIYGGVIYHDISGYNEFLRENYIQTSIISRYSEYIPLTIKNGVQNVYLVLHDLTASTELSCEIGKYKILCMSEWHYKFYTLKYPDLKYFVDVFPNGINISDFSADYKELLCNKIPYSFIYSSFPNRGLLYLLRFFPKIKQLYPGATLNIFCDLDNEYVQAVSKRDIDEIRILLKEQDEYVTNHGWVPKSVLKDYWTISEIWLYPCIFAETYCITALEAAASCTLAITNDIGALVDTVSDRGFIIPGDPTQISWENKVIDLLNNIYNGDDNLKEYMIIKNHEWSRQQDWKILSKEFDSRYIKQLNYNGMYNWTNDLPNGTKDIFINILNYFEGEEIEILEIGTYTGTSIINILNILPLSRGTVIDSWSDYTENKLLSSIVSNNTFAKFKSNLVISNTIDRVKILKGKSGHVLPKLIKDCVKYDLIYVDASHMLLDVYLDMSMSWLLLNSGGIMICDDYLWRPEADTNVLNRPKEAVDYFMKEHNDELEILNIGYRVFLKKIV